MQKKTILAAALASALAGSAMAADVTLYGVVDEGLAYSHLSKKLLDGTKESSNTLKLDSGLKAGSRWGLKGSESLGNGYTIGFKMESGFHADDGTLQGHRLFRRESSLTVAGPFGALSLGRMGGVASAAGPYDVVFSRGDSFDGLPGRLENGWQMSSRYDNMVSYQTPKMAGVQVTAQYSFKKSELDKTGTKIPGTEGKATADRYAALAVSGDYGNLQLVGAYERQLWSNTVYTAGVASAHNDNDDQNTFYLGGNYDFGVARVFAMGQYFTGARAVGFSKYLDDIGKSADVTGGYDGYSLHVGTSMNAAGGELLLGAYYSHAKTDHFKAQVDGRVKTHFYALAARYAYPLSTRTSVYAGAEYGFQKNRAESNDDPRTAKYTQVVGYMGLTHTF